METFSEARLKSVSRGRSVALNEAFFIPVVWAVEDIDEDWLTSAALDNSAPKGELRVASDLLVSVTDRNILSPPSVEAAEMYVLVI